MDTQLIEQRALEVLAHCPRGIWNPQQPPVPVDEIAYDCYDLDVREVEPEVMASAPGAPELGPGQSLSGLLIPSLGQIWVNAEEARRWPGRRRFTISHELGHHVLHQTGQQSLFCRHATVKEEPADEEREPLPLAEQEANHFAASLLMPAVHIKHYYEETGRDFEALCRIFGTSGGAMGRRLRQVI